MRGRRKKGVQPWGDEILVASYDIDNVNKMPARWRAPLPHLNVVGHLAATKRYDGLITLTDVLSPHARHQGV